MVKAGEPGGLARPRTVRSADDRRGRRRSAGGDGGTPTPATSGDGADGASGGPSLTVAAVARRLGVAPATLRTWDRRYGLGPSEHLAGSHRRYSASDVSRLLVMRRLTLEGVAPSEAARAALEAPEPAAEAATPTTLPSVAEVVDSFSDAVPMAPDPNALVSAATHFDNAAVRWMLARVQPRDVLAWWTELVHPALVTLAERAVLVGPGELAAPALTAAAFAELRSRAAVAATRVEGDLADRPAVLTVPCGTGADLVAHVLATALQEQGVRSRVLSVVRSRAVPNAVERLGPTAVVVHVEESPGADEAAGEIARAVVDVAPGTPVFLHRQGAAPLALPAAPEVHRVRTLTGAVHEIVAVVG